MGPYCRFCDRRCFVHVPDDTPEDKLAVYRARFNGSVPIIATCAGGQALERETLGFSYDDLLASLGASRSPQPELKESPDA